MESKRHLLRICNIIYTTSLITSHYPHYFVDYEPLGLDLVKFLLVRFGSVSLAQPSMIRPTSNSTQNPRLG